MSIVDIRYREILNNCAVLAHNPGVLPSYSLRATGTVTIADTVGVDPTTTWDHALLGFSKQFLGLQARHSPDQLWTLDPVVSEPQLKALSAAFLYVLYGPPPAGSPYEDILRGPAWAETHGYHFDVLDQLRSLPPGWLHVGKKHDCAKGACYSAHCQSTYVWVMPADLPALSEFTLILLDIATVDTRSLAAPQAFATVSWTPKKSPEDACPQAAMACSKVEVSEPWVAVQEPPCGKLPGRISLLRPVSQPLPCVVPGVALNCQPNRTTEPFIDQPQRLPAVAPRQSPVAQRTSGRASLFSPQQMMQFGP